MPAVQQILGMMEQGLMRLVQAVKKSHEGLKRDVAELERETSPSQVIQVGDSVGRLKRSQTAF